MQRASAKAKGKRHETATAMFYRRHGFPNAERTPSSGAMVQFPGDVLNVPFNVECKADERLSVWAALKQAEASAGDRLPVAHMVRSNGRGQTPTRIVAMPEWVWGWVLDNIPVVRLG